MPQELAKFIHRRFESDQFVRSIAREQRGGEFSGLDCRTFIQLIPHKVKFFGDQSNSSDRLVHKNLSVLILLPK